MVRAILPFMFAFILFATQVMAANPDSKLQDQFGPDLTKAPFFLQFTFSQQYGKDWSSTDYSERKAFLNSYVANLTAQQAKEKAEARAEAIQEKEDLREKKEELRKKREALRIEEEKEKAEERADEERQREFDRQVQEQEQELQQMEQQSHNAP